MNPIVFFAALAGIYFFFSFVSRKLFFQGKVDSENYMVYNVSSVLEYTQILFFLLVISFQIYTLTNSRPIWYEWIIPVIMLLVFLSKALIIFGNRNNFLKVRNNEICYQTGKEYRSILMKSYCFYQSTDTNKGNWYLEINGIENGNETVKTINLNDINLQGFRKSMERYFEAQNYKKAVRNSAEA
jgi:hypothetical protein